MTEGSNAIRQNYDEAAGRNRALNFVLWFTQGLLALLFLLAGGSKLVMTMEQMKGPGPEFPEWFVRFLGVAELLGGLGLVLPGLFRIRPMLTPLAAAGLVIIMIGATSISLASGPVSLAIVPFVAGLLAAFVAYGRWKLAPHADRRQH